MGRSIIAGASTLALSLLSACASGPSGPVLSAAQFAQQFPPQVATLMPGDRIRIALYGEEAMTGEYDVSADGAISLPLIGAVPVKGLTIDEVARTVETKLGNGFYANPRISAQLVSQQPIYVLGEVNKPGSFPFAADMTLSKAAALAGGYTYRARMGVVAVRRAGATSEVLVDGDQAMKLAPGDTVRVLERYF